jgi:acyl carrier protein
MGGAVARESPRWRSRRLARGRRRRRREEEATVPLPSSSSSSDIEAPSRDEIFAKVVEILSDSFELDPKTITRTSTLYEELDLDSIDAIDIFTQLRELTGRRPDPADARKVRTVDELIDFVVSEIEKVKAGVPDGPAQPEPQTAPQTAAHPPSSQSPSSQSPSSQSPSSQSASSADAPKDEKK